MDLRLVQDSDPGFFQYFRSAGSLRLPAASLLLSFVLALVGCQAAKQQQIRILPHDKTVVRDQLVVHSDFQVPKKHRLLEELIARRGDIADRLKLPTSDEPINIFLFGDADSFRGYMEQEFPNFADRRAFFVKSDTTLKVIAYWGDRVGEDLRHEVTHGYLHSVVPNMPLWLDEGIAEYFETPRGRRGLNEPHVYLLANAFRRGEWSPDLIRLEALERPESMTQRDYAEAWLWVHFLLEADPVFKKILQDQMARLRMSGDAEATSSVIQRMIPQAPALLVEHLKALAENL